MKFKQPLQTATLIRRYKRFLADVELPSGEIITVHCPNSGSMLGCREPGMEVRISRSDNPARKYPHTLEMMRAPETWVGINTSRTNHLVREALGNEIIKEIRPITAIRAEVKVSERSRLDFCISTKEKLMYLEVKNCTLAEGETALFPDAVTSRGAKHLEELIRLKRDGHGAAVLFCIQREDAKRFAPADHIDPTYAEMLRVAQSKGVLTLAYQAIVNPEEIRITHPLPVITAP